MIFFSEYICNECGRDFKLRMHIVRHLKSHELVTKVYPCPYKNCGRYQLLFYYKRYWNEITLFILLSMPRMLQEILTEKEFKPRHVKSLPKKVFILTIAVTKISVPLPWQPYSFVYLAANLSNGEPLMVLKTPAIVY